PALEAPDLADYLRQQPRLVVPPLPHSYAAQRHRHEHLHLLLRLTSEPHRGHATPHEGGQALPPPVFEPVNEAVGLSFEDERGPQRPDRGRKQIAGRATLPREGHGGGRRSWRIAPGAPRASDLPESGTAGAA